MVLPWMQTLISINMSKFTITCNTFSLPSLWSVPAVVTFLSSLVSRSFPPPIHIPDISTCWSVQCLHNAAGCHGSRRSRRCHHRSRCHPLTFCGGFPNVFFHVLIFPGGFPIPPPIHIPDISTCWSVQCLHSAAGCHDSRRCHHRSRRHPLTFCGGFPNVFFMS